MPSPDLTPAPKPGGTCPVIARWILVAVLFLAGWWTRGWEVTTLFDHPDEPITIGLNRQLDRTWDTNWKLAGLPEWFDYDQYNFSSYHYVVHAWSKLARPFLPESWNTPRDGVVALRTFSVVCGALVVVWSFLVGEQIGGWLVGLAGGLMVLANPQLVADGHYARAEAWLTWLTLVVVWLALKVGWSWRWRLVVSALLVGFMIAAKVTLGLLVIAPVWIAWTAALGESTSWNRWRMLAGWVGLAAALTIAGFALGAPGAVLHPDAFLYGVKKLADQYGGFHPPHSEFDGSRVAPALIRFYLVTVGIVGIFLALAATEGWLRRRQWKTLILVAAPVVFYVVYFATKRVFFERNLSHVLPLGLIATGEGIVWLATLVTVAAPVRRLAAVALTLLLAVAPGAVISWSLLTRSFSGVEDRAFERYASDIRAKYADLEWRSISLIFPDDLMIMRKNFLRDHKPILVQYGEFNDSYNQHYGEILDRDFTSYDVGTFKSDLMALPCSTLNVYHGHHIQFKIITGRRWPGPSAP